MLCFKVMQTRSLIMSLPCLAACLFSFLVSWSLKLKLFFTYLTRMLEKSTNWCLLKCCEESKELSVKDLLSSLLPYLHFQSHLPEMVRTGTSKIRSVWAHKCDVSGQHADLPSDLAQREGRWKWPPQWCEWLVRPWGPSGWMTAVQQGKSQALGCSLPLALAVVWWGAWHRRFRCSSFLF